MAQIYLITNTANGKYYVGQTIKDSDSRWKDHIRSLQRNFCPKLYAAIRKYGKEFYEGPRRLYGNLWLTDLQINIKANGKERYLASKELILEYQKNIEKNIKSQYQNIRKTVEENI